MKMHAAIKLTAILLLFTSAASFSQIHLSGPQSGTLIDTTYLVDGDIFVEQGDSLIIEPGANFLFNGPYKFEIQGLLLAIGRQEDLITFRPNTQANAWKGIDFLNSSSDSCILRYCVVEGSNDHGILLHSGLTIDHCIVRWNKGGDWGGGIYVSTYTSKRPVISNCLITENYGSVGGGIGVFPGNVTITNCIITGNRSRIEGGGINLETSACSAKINRCLITQNISDRGGGIYLCYSATATIVNCTIVGNSAHRDEGGGIGLGGYSVAQIINNIVAYNNADGINFENNLSRMKYNCAFHNAGADFTGEIPDSLGILTTINANGDSCDIYHNIMNDPLFINPSDHNYHLQAISPCIDAGNPRFPFDPDSTIADIGAFYYDQSLFDDIEPATDQPSSYHLLYSYPNPFNSSTNLMYNIPSTGRVALTIYNVLGQHIITLFEGIQSAGTHTATWDATDYPSGIYFARLQTGEYTKTIKMVLLK